MKQKDGRRDDLDRVPVAGFLMIFFPIWTVICGPMVLWIAVSAFFNIVSFFIELSSYSISISRWLIACVLLFCGIVVQVVFLSLLLTGQSERQKLKRIAVLSIPLMMMFSIPIVLIGNGMAWIVSLFIPVNLAALAVDGPLSIGRAMGNGLGLIFGPLLFFVGLARGVLVAGHPAAQFGCSAISDAAALGLIDISSLFGLLKSLLTLPANWEMLEILGFTIKPAIYSLNWWSTVSVAGYVEATAEITVCYASGGLGVSS